MSGLGSLRGQVMAITTLAVVDVTAIAVLTQFKTTGLVDNTTVDLFIAGLVVFGSFIGVLALAVIGKVIFEMFKGN